MKYIRLGQTVFLETVFIIKEMVRGGGEEEGGKAPLVV